MSSVAETITCSVCHHHCQLRSGQAGFCRARKCIDNKIVDENYGRITSIAIDPIEKKPFAEWHPGSRVLSVGSYGCNLRCPFCQNWEISQVGDHDSRWQKISPKNLVDLTLKAYKQDQSIVGIAYTYNEPLVGWEYVRDCALLAHKYNLATVLVSNGCANIEIIDKLAPLVDAANIDLKSISSEYYKECAGDLDLVKGTIQRLDYEKSCHLEVTTLIVNGRNDSLEEIKAISKWLASIDPKIVLHITRFFPCWKVTDRPATPVSRIQHLASVARTYLPHVYVGNC